MIDLKLDTLGKRIRFIQGKMGGGSALQKASGISPSQFNRLLKDQIENPGINQLLAISKVGNVSLIWLITGIETEVKVDDSYVNIPFYENKNQSPVLFDKNHLETVLNVKAQNCVFETVHGDAMSPTLNNGDQVLIDKSHKTGDGVFLVKIGGEVMIKRLQHLPGLGIEVISDNKNYKSYHLDPEKIEIIGRKVWVGGRS